jgi:hypothetical protein
MNFLKRRLVADVKLFQPGAIMIRKGSADA